MQACPKLYQNPDCKCAARKEEVQEVEFANIAVIEKWNSKAENVEALKSVS